MVSPETHNNKKKEQGKMQWLILFPIAIICAILNGVCWLIEAVVQLTILLLGTVFGSLWMFGTFLFKRGKKKTL